MNQKRSKPRKYERHVHFFLLGFLFAIFLYTYRTIVTTFAPRFPSKTWIFSLAGSAINVCFVLSICPFPVLCRSFLLLLLRCCCCCSCCCFGLLLFFLLDIPKLPVGRRRCWLLLSSSSDDDIDPTNLFDDK